MFEFVDFGTAFDVVLEMQEELHHAASYLVWEDVNFHGVTYEIHEFASVLHLMLTFRHFCGDSADNISLHKSAKEEDNYADSVLFGCHWINVVADDHEDTIVEHDVVSAK